VARLPTLFLDALGFNFCNSFVHHLEKIPKIPSLGLVLKHIDQYRNNWKQHVQNMDLTHIPRQMMTYRPQGKRSLPRLVKRWRDTVAGHWGVIRVRKKKKKKNKLENIRTGLFFLFLVDTILTILTRVIVVTNAAWGLASQSLRRAETYAIRSSCKAAILLSDCNQNVNTPFPTNVNSTS
jgi:hypothetical protein